MNNKQTKKATIDAINVMISHADGLVPHLVAVQEDQTNGFSPGSGQGIPHITAGGAAAAVQSHASVHGVAGGAGAVAAPGLNAVQGIVGISNAAVPGKVPAQIFDVRRPSGSAAIGLVSAGNLRIEDGGVVAVVGIIKQHNAVLGAGNGHHRVVPSRAQSRRGR